MTGNPLRLERYCRRFPGAKGAPRSCPAGSIAVAGFGGAGPPRTERRISMSKSAKKQMSKKDRKRLEQLFRMIGSPNACEAGNARRLILKMLARYRKTWNDLTDLMRGDTNADTGGAAFDDDRSAEQHAGDAVDAGLPGERPRIGALHPRRVHRHEAARV